MPLQEPSSPCQSGEAFEPDPLHMAPSIKASGIRKTFAVRGKSVAALDNVSISVFPGQVKR